MDIAFHYFAVKAMAVLAGFDDDSAQVIAESSQMTDDFDYFAYWNCTNIPDEIRKNKKSDLVTFGGLFNPAQTGFLSGDSFISKTDYLNLIQERFQKLTCTPFHFPYPDRSYIGKKDYRVVPADVGDGSIISDLMIEARREYQDAVKEWDEKKCHRALMKLGILLHVFADTYAHQMFSGFNSDVNDVKLVKVINNSTEKDETEKYKDGVINYLRKLKNWASVTPTIGHMMLAHIPDLTHLSFTMEYTEGKRKYSYYRSNTVEFTITCKKILNYLSSCNNCPEIDEEHWGIYQNLLVEYFLTDISDLSKEKDIVDRLSKVWNFSRTTFHYSSEDIKKGYELDSMLLDRLNLPMDDLEDEVELPQNSTKASEDFYSFNIIAEDVLIAIYGAQPRKWK